MKDATEIVCVLDRSGSMEEIRTEAIGSFNRFLDEQKALPDEATLTLVLFDDQYDVLYQNKPLKDVPALTTDTFVPRGMTALLDAIGKTLQTVGERLANTPDSERPQRVLVCILTDGLENASKEYTRTQIHHRIEEQQSKYSWGFIYLGVGKDAFTEASDLGIAKLGIKTYPTLDAAMTFGISHVSGKSATYRRTGSL